MTTSSLSEPLLITAEEAARLLRISPRTLWSLSIAGHIPRVQLGRCVRYSIEELRRWIADRQETCR